MAVIETDTFARGLFRWKFSSLGHRVVSLTLLISTAFACVATTIQMAMLYMHERGQTLQVFDQIEAAWLRQIESALWPMDAARLEIYLDGLSARPEIALVELVSSDPAQPNLSRGFAGDAGGVERVFDLPSPLKGDTPAAQLRVALTFDPVWQTVQRQILATLLTDMAKAIAIGTLMLWIFDRLAAQRLRLLANQVLRTTWRDTLDAPRQDRSNSAFPDEIDRIIEALELMRADARDAYESLADANARTRSLNAALASANREQADLTTALSHDLVTPLNTLHMLMSELTILRKCGALDTGDGAVILSDAQATLERMRQQIQSVVQYSSLLNTVPDPVPVDLDYVLATQIERVEKIGTPPPASIESAHLGRALVEPHEAKLLFYELLRNAVLYGADDRPNHISIRRFEPEEEGLVGIEIRDTGRGLAADRIDLAFQLFSRLHSYADAPGSGVGLVLCRRIVERHGGTIEMTSELGVGTCLRVSLPAEADDA